MTDTEPAEPSSGALALLNPTAPFPSGGKQRITVPYEILVKRAIRGTYEYKGSTKKCIQDYVCERYYVDRCYRSNLLKAIRRLRCDGYIYPYQKAPIRWKLNLKGYFMKPKDFLQKKKKKKSRKGKKGANGNGKKRRKGKSKKGREEYKNGKKKGKGKKKRSKKTVNGKKKRKLATLQDILCPKKKKKQSKKNKGEGKKRRRRQKAVKHRRTAERKAKAKRRKSIC